MHHPHYATIRCMHLPCAGSGNRVPGGTEAHVRNLCDDLPYGGRLGVHPGGSLRPPVRGFQVQHQQSCSHDRIIRHGLSPLLGCVYLRAFLQSIWPGASISYDLHLHASPVSFKSNLHVHYICNVRKCRHTRRSRVARIESSLLMAETDVHCVQVQIP